MGSEKINENYPELEITEYVFEIPTGQKSQRIDVYLTNSIKFATRNKVQKAIEEGRVFINGCIAKPSKKIQPGDKIICKILKPPSLKLVPENIPLNIIWEDDYVLVVNKPPNMVTHPGFGNRTGTLVNAVLYHLGKRESIEVQIDDDEEEYDETKIFYSDEIRPGIVHRLDKDTSGVMVIVKDSKYHQPLAKQFEERTVERFYYALVWGNIEEDEGTFVGDIGRNPRNRQIFAVVKKDGKPAITDYQVIDRFGVITFVKIKLRTGRTHQIRVHFSHNKHPVFGDPDYGGDKLVYGAGISEKKKILLQCLSKINRQMLHAKILAFNHPVTGERLYFESDLPDDFQIVMDILEKNKKALIK